MPPVIDILAMRSLSAGVGKVSVASVTLYLCVCLYVRALKKTA